MSGGPRSTRSRRLLVSRGAPRRRSAADTVLILKRSRILIAAFAVGCAVIAYLISATGDDEYVASAQVSFSDPLADLQLIGPGEAIVPEVPLIVRAERTAALLERDDIVERVRKKLSTELETELTTSELEDATSSDVDDETAFLTIESRADEAELAAGIANGFAEAVEAFGDEEELDRIERAREALAEQVDEAKKDRDKDEAPSAIELSQQAILGSLKLVLENADPVEIEAPATAPDEAATRAPLRNGAIGLALALLLGCLAALLREAIDRRVHTVEQIAAASGLPVIARVRASALGTGGLASGTPRPVSENDFEAFRSLRANLAFLAAPEVPRSVLVTSGSPEEGKTTVSAGLASAAALAGQRVLLIECDMRRPALAERLRAGAGPGLSEYLAGTASPREILQVIDLLIGGKPVGGGDEGRFVLVSAGKSTAGAAELLMNPRFADLLDKVGTVYDLVVLDGGPLLNVADPLELVPLVEGVIVCARAGKITREQLGATVAALRNLPERPAGVVVTGIRSGGPDGYEYYG